jgi:hypothetical protein
MAGFLFGGLLAGHLEIKGRLVSFSPRVKESWSKPTFVNDSPDDDRNPALGQSANGNLVVLVSVFWPT